MQAVNPQVIEQLARSPARTQWVGVGMRHHHGIVLPLFSLHSRLSCGIGEYPDLAPLLPWCQKAGLDLIQLLPLNDTGLEPSPYSALSDKALNPIHLGLAALPHVTESATLQQQIEELRQLNRTPRVPYRQVQAGKEQFLRAYYQHYQERLHAQEAFRAFRANHPWLAEYALFKALKIKYAWQSWESWPTVYRNPTAASERQLPAEIQTEMEYHILLQYLCFQQLQEIKKQAEAHGVLIKGDLPILTSRESASVWHHRELFNLHLAAGAPPDMYASEGQNWGFPIYDWDALAAQNYRWWIERLAVAAQFYHIYRLDHVVGLFRIWSIPEGKHAKEGFFVPADSSQWIPQGEKMLRTMLLHSSMLPIGEDLGIVPLEVRECLHTLGISGTKVMRWERRWKQDQSYIPPAAYPADSMTTVSTHDSETLQQWWENHSDEARAFAAMAGWDYSPLVSDALRFALLRMSHQSHSLFHVNLLQEYLALIPGMTGDPQAERINIPGTISENNWSYRFKPSVEEIAANPELMRLMRLLID
jgi:4-alpha-glucanotransferase